MAWPRQRPFNGGHDPLADRSASALQLVEIVETRAPRPEFLTCVWTGTIKGAMAPDPPSVTAIRADAERR